MKRDRLFDWPEDAAVLTRKAWMALNARCATEVPRLRLYPRRGMEMRFAIPRPTSLTTFSGPKLTRWQRWKQKHLPKWLWGKLPTYYDIPVDASAFEPVTLRFYRLHFYPQLIYRQNQIQGTRWALALDGEHLDHAAAEQLRFDIEHHELWEEDPWGKK